ncbi:MAG: hypothetical protein A2W91_15000 [Bacteroidetes bacterium GWF2_38_335]|nr:MAG: hypothetical protein A2W91_15000 [Bacteroidetes bacterium GWF2_38_335]OFY78505.1 MAG: hypothetical protein A2281_16310 [Bacteroidetes bacterium RIFOXYA12_FULL_38_20]HBS88454.1 hypothetical protein [Bacteroidales bacterium]
MKGLFLKLILFFAGFAVLVAALFSISPDVRFRYNFIKGDCDAQGSWIYETMRGNDKPGIVFLGSSHTLNAVNEKIIMDELKKTGTDTVSVANFGYCRYGRNLQYVLLKDLIKSNKPKMVIFEVTSEEPASSHPVFGYLAEPVDVFSAPLLLNFDYFRDIYYSFIMQTSYIKSISGMQNYDFEKVRRKSGYHWANKVIPKNELVKSGRKRRQKFDGKSQDFFTRLEKKLPDFYLEKVISVCRENNIRIIFLYLPSYGLQDILPVDYEFYNKNGLFWNPPSEIFNNFDNWADDSHLNVSGAGKISVWLSEKIAEIIK